jgi:hypothetical protein
LQGTADFGLKTLQIGSTIFGQSVNLLNDLGILHGRRYRQIAGDAWAFSAVSSATIKRKVRY